MLPLSERFADRAKRKAENEATSTEVRSSADKVGSVADAINNAQAAAMELNEAERNELEHRLRNDGEPSPGWRAADLQETYAGVGIVNPLVAPSALSGQGGNGGGAPVNLTPEQIEAERQRVAAEAEAEAQRQAQAPGWGDNITNANDGKEAKDETVGEDGKPLTKAQLAEILTKREVAFESDANLERLQTLVRENPAKPTA